MNSEECSRDCWNKSDEAEFVCGCRACAIPEILFDLFFININLTYCRRKKFTGLLVLFFKKRVLDFNDNFQ